MEIVDEACEHDRDQETHYHNNRHAKKGSISLIMGPMFSGKSTEGQRLVRRATFASQKCLVVAYEQDKRYTDKPAVVTHDGRALDAVRVLQLSDVSHKQIADNDFIFIDEGQFYPDLADMCDNWANLGKTIVVSALDGDFRRKAFPSVSELIPLCETTTKLTAICVNCKDDASFTHRKGTDTAIKIIGGADMYVPLCRICYNKEKI